MASYQITCATKIHPHRHITKVGNSGGSWTVQQAREMIAAGHRLFTVSPSTGRQANVERYTCSCGIHTLKSSADSVRDNNLDNLPNCP